MIFSCKEKDKLADLIKKQDLLIDNTISIVEKTNETITLLKNRIDIYDKILENISKEIHRLTWEVIEIDNRLKKIEGTLND